MFETKGARILIDPLLVEEFGHWGLVGRVYPPRVLDIKAMPPVDAVVFTHEHEDHFNVPSMHRLSREIPVHISARSSVALHTFLNKCGFAVSLMSPDRPTTIGDLELTCFSPDHIKGQNYDEWDTMPFLVRDTEDPKSSFFSTVDVAPTIALEERVRSLLTIPGLWCYTHNVMNMSFQSLDAVKQHEYAGLEYAVAVFQQHLKQFRNWRPPAASLVHGCGMYFTGERAWMNNNFFPLSAVSLAEAFATVCPNECFLAPSPGETLLMEEGRIIEKYSSVAFLRTDPPSEWPDQRFLGDVSVMNDYEPASGHKNFNDGDFLELLDRIRDFAQYLYGGPLFRALYSLTHRDLNGKRPAHVLILRAADRDSSFMLEYSPMACDFKRVHSENPVSEYLMGTECYGSDLLELLRGGLPPSALYFGRTRRWGPKRLPIDLDISLWMYTHPLRRPDKFLDLYSKILAAEPPEPIRVKARAQASKRTWTAIFRR